jgi:hypothetical protein
MSIQWTGGKRPLPVFSAASAWNETGIKPGFLELEIC